MRIIASKKKFEITIKQMSIIQNMFDSEFIELENYELNGEYDFYNKIQNIIDELEDLKNEEFGIL